MKKVILLLIITSLSLSFVFAEKITLVSFSGTVQIKEKESGDWINASTGQSLQPGFFIYTGFKSQALIQAGNAKIEVNPLSQITIASLIATKNSVETDVYLKYGRVRANVEKNEQVKTSFKVRSANSTASVRGTVFTFGNDSLSVENGTVNLTSNELNSTLVQQGEKAFVGKFSIVESPIKSFVKDYFVNTSPVGVSDSEADNDKINAGKASGKGKANVIITITVLQ